VSGESPLAGALTISTAAVIDNQNSRSGDPVVGECIDCGSKITARKDRRYRTWAKTNMGTCRPRCARCGGIVVIGGRSARDLERVVQVAVALDIPILELLGDRLDGVL
jgi:hypothetical protein